MKYTNLAQFFPPTRLKRHFDSLLEEADRVMETSKHGDLPRWHGVLERLPDIQPSVVDLNQNAIQIGTEADCSDEDRGLLKKLLMNFCPWRKGPYRLFGMEIDTEWRSDFKWDRLKDHIYPLNNRVVLDIGCGSGYHLWRMAGCGAKMALGIEPTLVSVMQFQAMKKYIQNTNVEILPFGIESIPWDLEAFDTVFSMGLLYHRKSPLDHLAHLKTLLRDGGELVLETLVINGKKDEVLVPEGRYAQMRNVWFLPSALTLQSWLKRMGFKNIRLIHEGKTGTDEQRVTDWMQFQSLKDFLDPQNSDLTVEGYPAPRRAIFLAENFS